jgi:hypothetical protein
MSFRYYEDAEREESMSWGERSCLKPCRCPDKCTMITCNVDCPLYVWDKETKPDSVNMHHSAKSPMKKSNLLSKRWR